MPGISWRMTGTAISRGSAWRCWWAGRWGGGGGQGPGGRYGRGSRGWGWRRAQCREAGRVAPGRIGGVLSLGLLSGMQGKLAEAIPLLRHVLAQRPDRPDARAALERALVKRAGELRREGRPGEADSLAGESEA